MNLASWIILAIVVAIVALAIRATVSKKGHGSCCDTGDSPTEHHCDCPSDSACASCSSCTSCPVAKNTLMPTIKYVDEERN